MYKKIIYLILLVFVTIIGLWGIPELVRTVSYSRTTYPFVYFSSVEKKLVFKEFDGSEKPWHNDEGKVYDTEKDYVAALPLFNYRQLTLNSEMPDSINGVEIDNRLLRAKFINFKHSPKDKNTPDIGLYIMYESLPKSGKLESPGDVFRFGEKIEFIDVETNTVNSEKSELFQSAMLKAGYAFPSQWIYGDMNIRKPYDEGYFSLDAKNELYHIKMVNGRPFVRNTQIKPETEPAYFSMVEPPDKRFYGFIFDKKGNSYIIEENSGKYKLVQLDIKPLNPDTDELTVLGNFLYWTVGVQTAEGKDFYGLDVETLKQIRHSFVESTVNRWDIVAAYLFPVYLSFKNKNHEFIVPELHFTAWTAFIANLIAAAAMIFILPRRSKQTRIFAALYTLVFGIAGMLATVFWNYEFKS